jgi:flagella basal body P-ring formation protein FlgA
MVMTAGTKVTLIARDPVARIEMQCVAQGSGIVGDRVRVRLLTLSANGGEQFLDGIVRSSGVVEMEAR